MIDVTFIWSLAVMVYQLCVSLIYSIVIIIVIY